MPDGGWFLPYLFNTEGIVFVAYAHANFPAQQLRYLRAQMSVPIFTE
jgi:hypothetical protein